MEHGLSVGVTMGRRIGENGWPRKELGKRESEAKELWREAIFLQNEGKKHTKEKEEDNVISCVHNHSC